jgi:hypothetical protein
LEVWVAARVVKKVGFQGRRLQVREQVREKEGVEGRRPWAKTAKGEKRPPLLPLLLVVR